uniref:XK-related protein n=1 Tax=Caenorhabditis tropicalis TaxID=1561998 RepID=A0A1I7TQ96_9PELO
MVVLTLREMTTWFDVTVFELWIHFGATIISSILLCLKFHDVINISYMWVASPLFIGLAFVVYFVFIIFLRSCVEYKDYRSPTLKFVLNLYRLTCITLFIYSVVDKISGELEKSEVANRNSYGMVFLPMWFLLGSWGLQMCRTSNT